MARVAEDSSPTGGFYSSRVSAIHLKVTTAPIAAAAVINHILTVSLTANGLDPSPTAAAAAAIYNTAVTPNASSIITPRLVANTRCTTEES